MNSQIFSVEDRIILKELYTSDGAIQIYEFHEKYLFSPAQLSQFVRKFQAKEIIQNKNGEFELTPKGKLWVFNNRIDIFVKNIDKFWRKPNEKMQIKRIEPFTPYIPNDKEVDSRLIDEYFENT